MANPAAARKPFLLLEPFTFVAPTCSADGYGYSAEALTMAAVREWEAEFDFVQFPWVDHKFNDPEFRDLWKDESYVGLRDTCVLYFLPHQLPRFRGRVRTFNMTMWETTRMPDLWTGLVQRYADGMIVPSQHCHDVFQERVDCPIEVVPFGTDTKLFTFYEREREPEAPFTFLMSGLLHYRKGLDFALRAFREEFLPGEQVRLWLKTRINFLDVGDQHSVLADPRVRIIDSDYPREQMVQLYHEADCLLAPSRGEGSGLTPRDALATGLPVILHDWSGLKELADPRYTWPVSTEALERAPLDNTSYGEGVTGGGDIGYFGRPSISELRAAMREVFEDRQAAYKRGRAAAGWMRREWSWEACSFRWLSAVGRLVELG